ncbi:hypothetical protein [Actinomadura sp. 9N215]|uniref:hypothetical protein n=1 Tax=Actinomadura sp. 9N215 TaxID=3375150 RepID=UPI0037AC1CDB
MESIIWRLPDLAVARPRRSETAAHGSNVICVHVSGVPTFPTGDPAVMDVFPTDFPVRSPAGKIHNVVRFRSSTGEGDLDLLLVDLRTFFGEVSG